MLLDWDRLRATVNSAGRMRCVNGWRLAPPWSDRLHDMDLWFVWAGRGTMLLRDGRRIGLRPGICFWMRPGGLYVGEQDARDRLGVSFIHFDLLDRRGRRWTKWDRLPPEVHDLADVEYVDAVLRRIVDLFGPNPWRDVVDRGTVYRRVVDQLLQLVLMEMDLGTAHVQPAVTGTSRHHRQIMLGIARELRENPAAVTSIAQLARRAGYSPSHFTRVFRTVIGHSPQQFLVYTRIIRAKQMLSNSSLTVSQIADALGYDSVYFFSKQFKLKTGLAPTEFRRMPAAG